MIPRDVDIADDIFGPDVSAIKGRTTKGRSEFVEQEKAIVPYRTLKGIQKCYPVHRCYVHLYSATLITMSRNIKMFTAE